MDNLTSKSMDESKGPTDDKCYPGGPTHEYQCIGPGGDVIDPEHSLYGDYADVYYKCCRCGHADYDRI